MSQLDLYLEPINLNDIYPRINFAEGMWGPHIKFYQGGELDYDKFQIAIIGVKEGRGSIHNAPSALAPDIIRKELYTLFKNSSKNKIIDLGNIITTDNVKDTYFALASVLNELRTNNIFTIILGGGNDLTYAQYLGYQESYEMINISCIDERVDIKNTSSKIISSESYLMPIFMHQPNYLFNYNLIGYQTYLSDPMELDMVESLNFDTYRLGAVREDLSDVEPTLRVSDMMCLDVSAIKSSDAPANAVQTPNGFTSEEICQIFRYAGYSDRLSSIGIYELNPTEDPKNQTAMLIAQCLWYFLEGFENRKVESPQANDKEFLRYTVEFEDVDHSLIFWKSKRTDRWWMELPYGDTEHYKKNQLIPCSYNDYLKACKEELPDRWMKAYNKLL
ncbi:MAG: formimidoylglutamase [Bacteroidota bacterium]